jgi:hypothetical protein
MMRLATTPIRRFLAFLLAVALSVCCCQMHFLAGGLSGDACVASDATVAPGGGCCDTTPAAPDGDPDAPDPCQACCIKGTGLKDGTSLRVDATLAATPAFTLPSVVIPAVTVQPDRLPRVASSPPWVEPRTLLRLRCALVV